MYEYDEECLKTFILNQGQLFDEPVAETLEEAEAFLEDCMASIVDSIEEVKEFLDQEGMDISGMSDEEIEEASEVFAQKRKMYKGVNANVDFYSGLVYSMLDLPPALYTPIFATARIVGWSAHRLEELKNVDKIIRPAYKPLAPYRDYIKLDDR